MTVHNEIIEKAHPFLPERGSWENPSPAFLAAIHDMLEGLGHTDWAGQIPGFSHGEFQPKNLVPH